jgi:DNA-binding transcriptional regulator YdaS (Cro superfamily)
MKLKTWVDAERGRTVWLAKQLGVTQPTVWNYVQSRVPAEHCPRIEEITAGVVTCEEMRPDVRWDIVRAGGVAPVNDCEKLPPAQQNIAQPATETVANTGD